MVDSNQKQFYVPVILGSTRRGRQSPKVARFIAGRMSRSEVLWFAGAIALPKAKGKQCRAAALLSWPNRGAKIMRG